MSRKADFELPEKVAGLTAQVEALVKRIDQFVFGDDSLFMKRLDCQKNHQELTDLVSQVKGGLKVVRWWYVILSTVGALAAGAIGYFIK